MVVSTILAGGIPWARDVRVAIAAISLSICPISWDGSLHIVDELTCSERFGLATGIVRPMVKTSHTHINTLAWQTAVIAHPTVMPVTVVSEVPTSSPAGLSPAHSP